MGMSKYEAIMWEEKMKERILSHARILYAWKLTPTSTLDVISTCDSNRYGCAYTSYIIMIDTTRYTECTVLLSSTSFGDSSYVGVRLERLLDCLSERLNPRLKELVQDAGEDAVVRKEGHYYSDGIFQSD